MDNRIEELEIKLQQLQHQVQQLENEKKYCQTLLDSSPDPIAVGNSLGKLVYINHAFCQMSGYSYGEIVNMDGTKLFSYEELVKIPLRYDLLDMGSVVVNERNLIHKAGKKIPVEMKTIKISDGIYQTVYRDIADRKKILGDLAEKERNFHMLFENMTNGFAVHEMIFDEGGKAKDYVYVEVNPAYENLTGLTAQNLIGKRVLEVIPELDYSWIYSFGEVVKTGNSCVIENYVEPLNRYYELLAYKIEGNQFAVIFSEVTEKKLAERVIRESEERFRKIVENVPVGIGILDMKGNVKFQNSSFGKLFGYDPESIKNIDTWLRLAYPDEKYRKTAFDIWNSDIADVLEGKVDMAPVREYLITDANKHIKNVEINFSIINNDLFVTFNDVTFRKRAEAELMESEKNFRLLTENSSDLISRHNPEGCFIYVTPSFEHTLGYTPEELIGKNPYDFFHPDDLTAVSNTHQVILSSRVDQTVEYRFQHKNGHYVWLETTSKCIFDKDGNVNEIHTSSRDITKRKEAETALIESQNLLRILIDSIPDLIYVKDKESRFLVVNKALACAIGTTVQECIGKTDFDFFPEEKARLFYADEQRLLNTGESVNNKEEMINGPDGGLEYISTNKVPIRNSDGEIIGLAGSGGFITERKKAEQALLESQRMLEAVLDSIPLRVFWKDRNSVYLGCNKKHALDNGLQNIHEVIGKNDFQLSKNNEEARKFVADDKLVMESGIPKLNYEEQLTTPGGLIWLNTSKVPLVNANGEVIGVLGTYEDITEKKRITQALLESEKRVQMVVRNAPLVLFIINREKRFTFSDGKGLEKLGLKPGQVVGLSVIDVYKDFPDILRNIDLALSGLTTRETVFVGDLAFDTQFEPIRDSNGEIEGIIGVSTDVSDKVKADKAFWAIQQRISLIVKNAPLIIFAIDKNGLFTFGDGKGLEKMGLKPNELVGVSVFDFYGNNPELIDIINQVISGNSLRKTILINDMVFDTQYSPIFNENGEVESIVGISTDISDRVKAEKELKNSEEKFRLLAENLPGVIYMCKNDKTWTSLYLNDYIYKMTGYSKEQFYSAEVLFADLYHPDDKSRIYEEVDAALALGTSFHLVYRLKHANGHYIWIEEVGDAIRKNGNIQYLEGYMSNVTDLKNAEESLKNMNVVLEKRVEERTSQLEKVNQELSEFAYIVSHDLKAPLRGINQLAEWLATDYNEVLGSKGAELIVLLKGRVNRLENLINAILEYSRAGRATIRDEVVEIDKIVNVAIDMLSPPSFISIKVETNLPVILSNKIQMGQVFQNLIGNAIKFMDKSEGIIRIGHYEESAHYVFYVIDNGPGIEQKYFGKIFQMFQTLNARDEKESTGIGLALVKKIIELYGGSISIESEKGKGCTFTFRLPKPNVYEQ